MTQADPSLVVDELRKAWEPFADPERSAKMAAYMKSRFEFFGVPAADRRGAQRPILAGLRRAPVGEIVAVADACWAEPEREFQYAGADLLRTHAKRLDVDDLGRVERLIRTKSWWDTVDALAVHVVGRIGRDHPALSDHMDRWIDDDDIWIARTAILHQHDWKDATDRDRLFGYVRKRAADREFFIRKALGWALRAYGRTDPEAVRNFAAAEGSTWSGLTFREATRLLDDQLA